MSLQALPSNLPVPQADGACDHLPGSPLPQLTLPATDGSRPQLSTLAGRVVLYLYPMTGTPGLDLPDGWNETPAHVVVRRSRVRFVTTKVSLTGLARKSLASALNRRANSERPPNACVSRISISS